MDQKTLCFFFNYKSMLKALGEGTAPVAAVREYAIAHGLEMVVESETLNPTGIKEVERCIKYLRSLEA